MLRRLDDIPQNVDNLKDIFERVGDYTFLIKGEGIFHYEQESIKAFIWIPRCSIDLLKLSNCIELDTSFKATDPDVYAVPQLIYKNTGVPISLIVGPTESSELYALLYRAIEIIDQNEGFDGQLYEELLSKSILSDQHSAFDTLQNIYGLYLYHCYIHIIRSFGARSAISILVREILFCKTENEFEIYNFNKVVSYDMILIHSV